MLVTKEDVKKALNYNNDGNDDQLDDLIGRVEADFKQYIGGTTFDATAEYATETDYLYGNGMDVILVNKYPARTVTSIHLDPDREFGADSLVPSADIVTSDLNKGIIYLDGHFTPRGPGTVKIVYTAGYKKTDAPLDFKQIIINEVVAMFLENIGGVNTVEESDFIYRPDKLRKSAETLKKKYRAVTHGF